jgi:hypothetical protein
MISDAEVALALEGMGVYATDASRPLDPDGNETDWQVAPGVVLELPGATMFKRVEGIKSVTPVLDLVNFLQDSLYEASGTSSVARGEVDVNLAESGIALAIKFIPTLSKTEHRDRVLSDVLVQMFFDLKFWIRIYESQDFTGTDVEVKLGDKLPVNRPKRVEELNNMLDRNIISMAYYRKEMEKLGYVFPSTMEQEILDEMKRFTEAKTPPQLLDPNNPSGVPGPGGRQVGPGDTLPKPPNQSNNQQKPNESKGTEIVSRK